MGRIATAQQLNAFRANRTNPGSWGNRGRDTARKMSSWNVALEEYNRFNNGNGPNGGAFAIPSRTSPDYDLVFELAQQIRTRGRPVTWEEMDFPDLNTQIGRPVKPCPGGSRTPSRADSASVSYGSPSRAGSVNSRVGTPSTPASTVPYDGGSSSRTPSRAASVRTVLTTPPSRAPSMASNDTRRTLDFREADNFVDYGGYARSNTSSSSRTPSRAATVLATPQSSQPASRAPSMASNDTRRTLDFREADVPTYRYGQWNPENQWYEGVPPRTDMYRLGGTSRSSSSTSGGYNSQSGRFELPDD